MNYQQTLLDDPLVERIELRNYQIKVINDLYEAIRSGSKKVVLVAPTGAGKTIIASQIIEHAVERGRRVLFVVHLDILVGQTVDKLRHWGLHTHCGFIKAGWPEERDAQIQVASIQTMSRRRWWRTAPFDVVIFDEAHQTAFSEVGKQLIHETHPDAKHIGLTATPYRLSRREGLGDHFDDLVSAPPPAELQRLGMLAPMRYFGLPQADLSGVKTVAGDFDSEGLKNACDKPELVARAVEEWQRITPDKRTIAFCVDVEHALHLASAFRDAGVSSATVTGETPINERHQLYTALRDGSLKVLTSVNVVSIGFDEPSVEVGLLCRPTKSIAMHHQQIGRVMRIASGKDYGTILDQSGNCLRLGFPEDITSYRLTKGEEPAAPGEAPKKECDCCHAIAYAFEKFCPQCGFEFKVEAKIETADLVELSPKALKDQRHISSFHRLRREAYRKGYDPKWAFHQFKAQHGFAPKTKWYQGSIFGDEPTDVDFEGYWMALEAIASKKGKNHNWCVREWVNEFGGQHSGWLMKNVLHIDMERIVTELQTVYGLN